jgi:hypothetical protein
MILLKEIEILQRAHRLIAQSQTGTPQVFSRRLGISERRLYGIIDEMKTMGAPIRYSRLCRTYYYVRSCEARLECSFYCLPEEESRKISGGKFFYKKIFTACFVQ